jgi:hypothetical protein
MMAGQPGSDPQKKKKKNITRRQVAEQVNNKNEGNTG